MKGQDYGNYYSVIMKNQMGKKITSEMEKRAKQAGQRDKYGFCLAPIDSVNALRRDRPALRMQNCFPRLP